MTTTKTHISKSGKRVPCHATKRACHLTGHQTVAAESKSEQGFQAAAARAASTVDPVTARTLVARRVNRGANQVESELLLADLLSSHKGDNLASALVYNDFATPAKAEKIAAGQNPILAKQPAAAVQTAQSLPEAPRRSTTRAPKNFFASEDKLERRGLSHTARDAETLNRLAKDKDTITVIGVAANRHTPIDTITALANHKDWGVRAAVAKNPSTPIAVKDYLKNDPESFVRNAVA